MTFNTEDNFLEPCTFKFHDIFLPNHLLTSRVASPCLWDLTPSPLFILHTLNWRCPLPSPLTYTSATLTSTSSTPNPNLTLNIQPVVCLIKLTPIPSSTTTTFHSSNISLLPQITLSTLILFIISNNLLHKLCASSVTSSPILTSPSVLPIYSSPE